MEKMLLHAILVLLGCVCLIVGVTDMIDMGNPKHVVTFQMVVVKIGGGILLLCMASLWAKYGYGRDSAE